MHREYQYFFLFHRQIVMRPKQTNKNWKNYEMSQVLQQNCNDVIVKTLA